MKPSIFILEQEYSSYNISIMVGIILSIYIFYRFEKLISEPEKDNIISIIGITLVIGFLSAILGNKLLHFQSWNDFKIHLFQFTGMTFICGLIGGFICFTFIYSITNRSISKTYIALNIITPYFIIAQIWGRIGCLLGGCCYGKPTNSILGITYPENSVAFSQYGYEKLYPTPIMEILLLLLILLVILKINNLNKKTICYLLMYTLGRFFIEFFRGDNRGHTFYGMSPSQTICLIIFIIVILSTIIYNIKIVKYRNKNPPIDN